MTKYTLLIFVAKSNKHIEVSLDKETYEALAFTPKDDGLQITLQVSEGGELREAYQLI